MRNLKKFLFVLVFLFLLSSALFSVEPLDPSEMTNEEIWIELGKNYEENLTILNEKELILSEREKNLDIREHSLNERENSLNVRESLMSEINNYLTNLKEDRWQTKLQFFGLGTLTGFVLGNYTGFSLALKLEI